MNNFKLFQKNSLIYTVLMFFGLFHLNTYACSPAPGSKPSSMSDKVSRASYVFKGEVISIEQNVVGVKVSQYIKGNSYEEVKVSGFNQTSCDDFLQLGQERIFFANGTPPNALEAVYDGAFGSTTSSFEQATTGIDCMASYKDGVLNVPCVSVPQGGQIYAVELETPDANNPQNFKLRPPQLRKPLPFTQ